MITFLKNTKMTKLNDFLPLNAVLDNKNFSSSLGSEKNRAGYKVNLSVVRKNLFNSKHCSKIKKMHDHAVLDIELTLFSEKAPLLLVMLLPMLLLR